VPSLQILKKRPGWRNLYLTFTPIPFRFGINVFRTFSDRIQNVFRSYSDACWIPDTTV